MSRSKSRSMSMSVLTMLDPRCLTSPARSMPQRGKMCSVRSFVISATITMQMLLVLVLAFDAKTGAGVHGFVADTPSTHKFSKVPSRAAAIWGASSTAVFQHQPQQQQYQPQHQQHLQFEDEFVLDAANKRKVIRSRRLIGPDDCSQNEGASAQTDSIVDPSQIEFISTEQLLQERQSQSSSQASTASVVSSTITDGTSRSRMRLQERCAVFQDNDRFDECVQYPTFARMLTGSAPYIASHAEEVMVLYIPGELVCDPDAEDGDRARDGNISAEHVCDGKALDHLMDDIAITWLLGMKIVLVVGCTGSSAHDHRCGDHSNGATTTEHNEPSRDDADGGMDWWKWHGWAAEKSQDTANADHKPLYIHDHTLYQQADAHWMSPYEYPQSTQTPPQYQSQEPSSSSSPSLSDNYEFPRISDATMRSLQESAGFVRFELERKLNKCLTRHMGLSQSVPLNGNVIGGNFYTAERFQMDNDDRSQQQQEHQRSAEGSNNHAGYVQQVHARNIMSTLENRDIVLLTTMGASTDGEMIHVNGPHLAAKIAAECQAHKVIYMMSSGMVLRQQKQQQEQQQQQEMKSVVELNTPDFLQDIPLSFVETVLQQSGMQIHSHGFVTQQEQQEHQKDELSATKDETNKAFLMKLSWAAWAVHHGVTRAHIVNPGDGAILEELFTEQHGTNTCLFHDNEIGL